VEGWGRENSFNLKETSPTNRLYQKGIGFLVAPMMLQASCNGEQCTLDAWVRVNVLVRLMALFIISSEMSIESGGFRLVAPRSIARNAINKLLVKLGQPQIP
jgi:hypothetical protein